MKVKRFLLGFAVLAITAGGGAMANEIYKWTDEEGNVHYEDRPTGAATEERMALSYRRETRRERRQPRRRKRRKSKQPRQRIDRRNVSPTARDLRPLFSLVASTAKAPTVSVSISMRRRPKKRGSA
jgi:hypothetical protein